MYFVRPKKGLGQHFLKDHNIARKIVSGLTKTENVLEIGPGKGILSRFLADIPGINLKLIELDQEAVNYLNSNFPGKFVIHHADFMKADLNDLFQEPFSIIGNFPYNISSQIFFKILDEKDLVSEVVCMVQKEVAERIVSGPGNKSYGILSVFLQAYFKIEMLFIVNPTVFEPPPKVKSAVIRLQRNGTNNLGCDEKFFREIVKKSFNQRRKILRNSLKPYVEGMDVEEDYLLKRPEQLSIREFVRLTNMLNQKVN